MGNLEKFTHRGLDLWPNLFMTVGELKKPLLERDHHLSRRSRFLYCWPWEDGYAACGGPLKISVNPVAIDTLILTIFLLVTVALSLHGERFVLFATIPLSLLSAAAIDRYYQFPLKFWDTCGLAFNCIGPL